MPVDSTQDSYKHLAHLLAEAPKNVVFVVGAGLSIPAGVPGWQRLSKNLRIEAVNYVKSLQVLPESEKQSRIDKLNSLSDLWLLGDEIESALPKETYERVVRRELTATEPPPAYDAIWRLNPSGVISFNLDPLAARSLAPTDEQIATAREPGKFQRFLLFSGRPFLFQPHGRLDQASSWVLGARRRNELLKANHKYRKFLASLLSSRRLVIVGFQPKDFAFESLLLDDFREVLSEGLEHFWITQPLNQEDLAWADLYSIRPVIYEAEDDRHEEVVVILNQIANLEPREAPAPLAYDGEVLDPKELPEDEELRSRPLEDIRRLLNAGLAGLLQQPELSPREPAKVIGDFYRKYSGSVHMAWHVTDEADYGWVWGRRVKESLGEGGFGKVWKVVDPVDGEKLALKVLHEDVISEEGFVTAFRRGVNAMKILKSRGVEGMVRLVDAYDIPACLLMEYVEGGTLEDAIVNKAVTNLGVGVRLLEEVASIVRAGHELDERVLHRDLKPANVMIRDLWLPTQSVLWERVVVLDFDLSWYEGAYGRSTFHGKGMTGYLAPEQHELGRGSGVSSRHTAVDVFGLGMLLFFVSTGRSPDVNEQDRSTFRRDTIEGTLARWDLEFQGLPVYIAETIEAAACKEQNRRIGLPAFEQRLMLIRRVLEEKVIPLPSDVALLEMASRFDSSLWDMLDERDSDARMKLTDRSSGAAVEISFDPTRDESMRVLLSYAAGADIERKSIKKYTGTKAEQAAACLRDGGYLDVEEVNSGTGGATVRAWTRAQSWDLATVNEISERLVSAGSTLAFR